MIAKQKQEVIGMVERVARAIVGPHRPVPDGSPYTLDQLRAVRWGQANSTEQQNALNEARAAIEAMREPTDAMVRAARIWSPSLRETYTQMIDAALNEQVAG